MQWHANSGVAVRGFTLIEILVGMTIGMIAIIVMYQVFAVFESQRRTTTSGSDTQTTGLIGLYNLERDARMAGYGLVHNRGVDDVNYEAQLVCARVSYSPTRATELDGAVDGTEPLLPVQIIDNDPATANGSDTVAIAYSTSPFAAAAPTLSVAVAASATALTVKNAPQAATQNAVLAPGDYLLVATPAAIPSPNTGAAVPLVDCARVMVSAVAPAGTDTTVTLDPAKEDPSKPGHTPNPPTGLPAAYAAATSNPSLVVNMGQFVRNAYSVANRQLVVTDLTRNGAPMSLGENVVTVQAQYGVAPANCTQPAVAPATGVINCQSATTWVDATGAWDLKPGVNPADHARIARIKAIRVAVVLRSPLFEKEEVYPTASFATPCVDKDTPTQRGVCTWLGDAANPSPDIGAIVTADPDWRFYRYRVYETIVPLRNVIWASL